MTDPTSTRAVLVSAPGRAALVEQPVDRPGPGEVLVQVRAAGICGSDVELFAGSRPAEAVRYPVVPGHEWAGVVAETGAGVTGLAAGDPVTAEGIRWCGMCDRCRAGATNLCLAGYQETGFTLPGAFSGYVLVPARLVHRLPPDRPVEHGALLEPTACVAAAVGFADPRPGQVAAVVGGGTLGVLAVQLLALHAPAELVLVEAREDRRELGRSLGATAALAPDEAAADGIGADVVIEAAGRPGTAREAAALARRGGTVVLCGIPGEPSAGPDPVDVALRELHLHGVFGASTAAWAQSARLYRAGLLDLGALVTHRFALADFATALRLVAEHSPGTGKVLLEPAEPARP
jgi:2-desacetyl-2-hydroxyethyl bacteriochlorophyllide A dehydrogenase